VLDLRKENTAAANAALNLKKQHYCGKSNVGFEKATLLRQKQCWI